MKLGEILVRRVGSEKHTISDRLAKKLAEVAERKRESEGDGGASNYGASPNRKDYYRGPHNTSPELQKKIFENKEKVRLRIAAQTHRIESSIMDAVRKHYVQLSKNIRRSLILNEYGATVQDHRQSEIERFLNSISKEWHLLPDGVAASIVMNSIQQLDSRYAPAEFDAKSFPEDGYEFEEWLAASLKKFGWNTEVTKGSGDQGVDLIATKGETSIAIQAKRYSGKVGNRAVQEVYSGAKHLGISLSAVITTVGFTPSAAVLAQSTGVILLRVDDLPHLDELIHQ
ncbi:restriction system protein [Rhodovulum sulfidophilum]|uniref:restriction endonuclease n=1 Tax=Rhodovulum sulfidophilum TaxID=35806 RepID=UPI0009BE721E|nr:restriction endonuclease [Rhodovulum sulfidophilum]MCW2305595.1 restriction system protein [Rhodovulum sulfidophilum]